MVINIHAFSVLSGVMFITTFAKQVGSSANASDLYGRDAGFECQPAQKLSSDFRDFLQLLKINTS